MKTLAINIPTLSNGSWRWVFMLCLGIAWGAPLWAEGIKQVAPTEEDQVMLLINDANFGRFAAQGGPENSRLYVRVAEPEETIYFGFSRAYRFNGQPESFGAYVFQVRRASDGAVVHGPVLVSVNNENVTTWADAVAGPAEIDGQGYATSDEFKYTAEQPGDYYIEFSGISYLGLWDITVGKEGVEKTGRVYSRNWAFRTPESDPQLPDCVWGEEFNGKIYSYTTDGFVTEIDFADSGFQGLSFNVAFNRTGPGNTGNPEEDRKSVPAQNLTATSSEHLVFLANPDPGQFPDGACGEAILSDRLECADDGLCIPITLTRVGQVEILLDFNQNGQYDPATDRTYLRIMNDPGNLTDCIPWDGLMANGLPPTDVSAINIEARYTQGVQHWALYDAEFLANGFCIDVIRPVCAQASSDDLLYYDDRNIPDDPGTDSPKDGRFGCDCSTPNCRTFVNFAANTDDCGQINDNITTGYGDKNTLNTWWFARSETQTLANIPLLLGQITGATELCQFTSTELRLDWQSNAAIASIRWSGPTGLIAEGGPELLSITVETGGTYEAEILDVNGCTIVVNHVVTEILCPIDLSVDKSVDTPTPEIGQTLTYSVLVSNSGPGIATGIQITDDLPATLTNVNNINQNGQITGNQIVWEIASLGVGQSITLTYQATLVVGFGYRNVVEVTAADQPDTDSTPGNGADTDGDGNCADDAGDEDDGDCVELMPPGCALEVLVTNVVCNDNGTPIDASDDTWTFDLTVNGSNGGTAWQTQGPVNLSGEFGQTATIPARPIASGPVTFTVRDGFFGAACAETITVDPPATCSDQCLIEAEIVSILCLDNGTPTDDSDDRFEFQYIIYGYNASDTWQGPNGQSGLYGEVYTYGPESIADFPFIDFLVRDSENSGCTTQVAVTAPNTCSTECSIMASTSNLRCDDNGTPSIPGDDQYFFTVVVSGSNTSGEWTTDAGFGGSYDVPKEIGPLPIADGAIAWTIQDVAAPECTANITVVPPPTCSDLCAITSVDILDVTCDPAGTESFPGDDEFYVTVSVAGLNLGTDWVAGEFNGPYDEAVTIGPFSIAAGEQTLVFADALDPTCTYGIILTPPAPCSDVCAISDVAVTDLSCDNLGTPIDPTDDVFYFTIDVSGFNLAGNWTSPGGETGTYDEPTVLGPYAIADGAVTLLIRDAEALTCSYSFTVEPPETCSDECAFSVETFEPFCDDNGTPFDETDDVFYFDVYTEAINATAPTWTIADVATGAYGDTVRLGPFPIAAGDVSLGIVDADRPECAQSIGALAPATCSNKCLLEVVDIVANCDDGGAPGTQDDFFYYEILVTGTNVSPDGWIASDGTEGQYGVWTTSVPHGIDDSVFEITITDRENECSLTELVALPQPEVTCPPEFVDRYDRETYVQYLSGALTPDDASWAELNSLCWLPGEDFEPGRHYYDEIEFSTPGIDSVGDFYTFYLFTDMEPQPGWDPASADGAGGIFIGEYMEEDPCCSVASLAVPPFTPGALEMQTPYIDPNVFFAQPLTLVRQFSVYLFADRDYRMLTTTWGAEKFGNYQWVILPYREAAALRFAAPTEVAGLATDVTFDLTDQEVDIYVNEPYGDELPFGSVELSSYCGVQDLRLRDEVIFEDECSPTVVARTFEMDFGGETIVVCEQDILFRPYRLQDLVLPPASLLVRCDEEIPLLPNGSPDPSFSGTPGIVTAEGVIPIEELGSLSFYASFKDFPQSAENPLLDIFERRWSIVDICGDTSMIFTQRLKLEGSNNPQLVCPLSNHYCPILEEDIMLFTTDPNACTGDALLPEPEITGVCNPTAWSIRTDVFRMGTNGDSTLVRTLLPGEDRLLTDLPVGDYRLRYTVTNGGGSTQILVCKFRIADLDPPVSICRGDVTLGIGAAGTRQVGTDFFDLGSYDNCSDVTLEVRRGYTIDPVTCEPLDPMIYGAWGPTVDFACCDIGSSVWVQVRIIDAGVNVNFCTSLVTVVDDFLPQGAGLSDLTVSCDDLPGGFDLRDTVQLQARFGRPSVVDNCSAKAVELPPVVTGTGCAIESVRRRFQVTDVHGNEGAEIYEQLISLDYRLDYAIKFPRDTDTDCVDNVDTIQFVRAGCDVFEVSYTDVVIGGVGTECRRIARTYTVINACQYDGVSPPILIDRDENCDGTQGEADVYLVQREQTAFVDVDADPTNAIPGAGTLGGVCGSNENPAGYWREVAGNGAYRYTQFIRIFDTTPPEAVFTGPDVICNESTACSRNVELAFRLADACQMAAGTLEIVFDLDDDGTLNGPIELYGSVSGTFPDYTLSAELPNGTHRLRITATDDCDNTGITEYVFTIADCYLSPPTCFDGRTYDLATLAVPTDITGDGIPEQTGVRVRASELAAASGNDCSGPLRFSVNRSGELPDPARDEIWLSCADRYSVTLEVYAWDEADNPLAMQPDSSLGGPNWSRCEVTVFVQNPDQLCEDCPSGGTVLVDGTVTTPLAAGIPGVTLRLMQDGVVMDSTLSDDQGHYALPDLPAGGSYQLEPYKGGDYAAGVSTIDLLLLQWHILGIQSFTSPYQYIAADIDGNGQLSTIDLLLLQSLLLGNTDHFPNHVSWRFVPEGYDFTQGSGWAGSWSNYRALENTVECAYRLNWIGVKLGDINGSFQSGVQPGTEPAELTLRQPGTALHMADQLLPAGATIRVALALPDAADFDGGRFDLGWDPAVAEVVRIEAAGLGAGQFNTQARGQGRLRVLWTAAQRNPDEPALLHLVVRANRPVRSSDVFQLVDRGFSARVYDRNLRSGPLDLYFGAALPASAEIAWRVAPNPFREELRLSITTPRAGTGRIEIRDLTGRLVGSVDRPLAIGTQSVVLPAANWPPGVYLCTLTLEGAVQVLKVAKR